MNHAGKSQMTRITVGTGDLVTRSQAQTRPLGRTTRRVRGARHTSLKVALIFFAALGAAPANVTAQQNEGPGAHMDPRSSVAEQLVRADVGHKLVNAHRIVERFRRHAKVPVIVSLKPVDTGRDAVAEAGTRHGKIAASQDTLLARLARGDFELRHRLNNQATLSGVVTAEGLQQLLSDPLVEFVEPDELLDAHGRQALPLMNALASRSLHSGRGVSIAIVDTGIDTSHPQLGGGGFPNNKVIGGYDFGMDDPDPRPSGAEHGTACAGIAAGGLTENGDYIGGVAPNAKLYALKISNDEDHRAQRSAIAAAWDWCVTHQYDDPSHPIMVISTSFGGGRYFSACDEDSPAVAEAARNAVNAGITVLASSGNDGFCDSMGHPACLSDVLSVGAVYDASFGEYYPCVPEESCAPVYPTDGCRSGWYAIDETAPDKVASYANVPAFLDVLAPATRAATTDIIGPGGGAEGDFVFSFGGTSAACPYAAGAVAILQAASYASGLGRLSQAEIKDLLLGEGDIVVDPKSGIAKPRVNVGRALSRLVPSDAPPIVRTASPCDGCLVDSIDRVVVDFSEQMDVRRVETPRDFRVEVDGELVDGSLLWSHGDTRLTWESSTVVPPGATIVTLNGQPSSNLRDLAGNVLDGDRDGQPGGDFVLQIATSRMDDHFEPNDVPEQAAPIQLGRYDLMSANEDWFRLVLDEPGTLAVEIEGLRGDLDLFVYDTDLGTLGYSITSGATEAVETRVDSGSVLILIESYNEDRTGYTMSVGFEIGSTEDDRYEENDTQQQAKAISVGYHGNLQGFDEDWYFVDVASSGTIQLGISGPEGDLDLYLVDGYGIVLDWSSEYGSNEHLETGVASGRFYILVEPYREGFSRYVMDYSFERGPGPVPCGAGSSFAAVACLLGGLGLCSGRRPALRPGA